MTTEIKNTSEDNDMAEREGENVVTMMDVLKEQEDFEEDANAVLGGSDDKNCTYSKGYIKRQAIYACLTCCSEAKSDPEKRAGVCLACSLSCHENHELIELYTKRNFRCDCGNPKFNSHPCTFTPNKTDLNEDNIYNQNFSGLYCTCKRPYPDPESTEEDEMIQCIVCEDWLHSSHLETTSEIKNMQYSEMICKNCMEKNDFLHDYSELAVNTDILIDVVNGIESSNNVINGDAKNDEIGNISDVKQNNIATNLDVEMSEEKMEVPTENTSKVKDETLSKTSELAHKEEEITSETKENDMKTETGQKEEDTTANENTNKNEITVDDTKDNKESADTKDNEESTDTKHSDLIETKPEEMADEQNDNKKPNEEVAEVKETEVNSVESSDSKKEPVGAENKLSEADAEKMEEDRLLADPEDNVKPKDQEKENSIKTDTSEKAATKEENEPTKSTTDIENSEPSNSETVSEINVESEEFKTTEEKPKEETNEKSQEEIKTTTPNDTEMKSIEAESEINKDANEKEDSKIENEENKPDDEEKISEKRKLSIEDTVNNSEAKKPKLDDNNSGSCVRPRGVKRVHKGATFWPSTFRQKLCTCSECISMYKDLAVLFLIDPEDTVTAYENLGKSIINGKPQTQYEKGLEALSSLDRVQQINALTEYNIMKDKLLDFLKSFKDRREIVKEEDIRAFFAGMKPKKQPDGVYFCR